MFNVGAKNLGVVNMLVFETSLISFIGVIFSLIALFFLFRSYQYIFGSKKNSRKMEVYGSLFLGMGFLIPTIQTLFDYYQVQQAINSKLVKEINGITENFTHEVSFKDSFTVNGVMFEYIKGASPVFYNKIVGTGSAIRGNGQQVKIDYIVVKGENKIIKLWVYK